MIFKECLLQKNKRVTALALDTLPTSAWTKLNSHWTPGGAKADVLEITVLVEWRYKREIFS